MDVSPAQTTVRSGSKYAQKHSVMLWLICEAICYSTGTTHLITSEHLQKEQTP